MIGSIVSAYFLIGSGVFLGLVVSDEGYLESKELVKKLAFGLICVTLSWPLMLLMVYYAVNEDKDGK